MPEQPCALYERIKRRIVDDIDAGRLKPDDRVPSETQLAKAFNASRMTVNRALKELTGENRIVRVQGVGTFVARPKPDAALLEIRSIKSEIEEWGGIHSCGVVELTEKRLPPDIARQMDLEQGALCFYSVILHKDRDRPVQWEERYVNPAVAPDYLTQDFTAVTPGDYLLEIAPVQAAEHCIEAVAAPANAGAFLNLNAFEPCLSLTRRTWSFGRVATYSILLSPGSMYRLKGKFKQGSEK